MMRVLEREQWLPIPVNDAWAFFSTPLNLGKITPDNMGFTIRKPFDNKPVHEGQRIAYTVRPLFSIPLVWETCIAIVEPPYRFVDVQIRGPYKHWWHEHTFVPKDGGTLVKDRVEYELPLGRMGDLLHGPLIRRRLKEIFDFRHASLRRLFPIAPEKTSLA
jgi:ligand-binding SRPBCC domain-containing protein